MTSSNAMRLMQAQHELLAGVHQPPATIAAPTGAACAAQLDAVTRQLAPQLQGSTGTLVVIPTVGFGMQSHRVLPRTIIELARQGLQSPLTVVFLVNRPGHREDDGSAELIAREVAALPHMATRFAVASAVVDGRPQLGTLRQLAHDAAIVCLGGPDRVPLSIAADDDMVYAPPHFVGTLARTLQAAPGAAVALGPVLFDDPDLRSVLFVDFFIADVVRALLAARWTTRLIAGDVPGGIEDPWRQYAEAIALSGNLALRTSPLQRAGGFPPFNEITGIVQTLHRQRAGDAPGESGVAATWEFDEERPDVIESLLDHAVRISSRRALRAFVEHGVPPVGQWRAYRFHASRIDPARAPLLAPAPARVALACDATASAQLQRTTAGLIAATLACFPPDVETARRVLGAVGLDPSHCSVAFDPDSHPPWRVAIYDPRLMLERVRRAQIRLLGEAAPHGSTG